MHNKRITGLMIVAMIVWGLLGIIVIPFIFLAWPNWILSAFYLLIVCFCFSRISIVRFCFFKIVVYFSRIPIYIKEFIQLRKYRKVFNNLSQTIILKRKFLRNNKNSIIVENQVKIKETGEVVFAFQDMEVDFSIEAKFYLLKWLIQDFPRKQRHCYKIERIEHTIGNGQSYSGRLSQNLDGSYRLFMGMDHDFVITGYELSFHKPIKNNRKMI